MNLVPKRRSSVLYLLVVAYGCGLAWKAAHGYLASDDPMNMGWYWRDGFWTVLWHNITFWSTAYRPLGGLYYLPLYAIFKLNSTPYRILILAVVIANSYLTCRTAELLTGSRAVAFLAGILCAAHAALVVIYYNNSSIYDILAYFFMMVILIRYVTLRQAGIVPEGRQAAILIVLFILALDAKEMSVVIAGFVLAYEVLYHGGPWNWERGDVSAKGPSLFTRWLKHEGRISLVFIFLVAIYTAGKFLGPHPLMEADTYRVHLSRNLYVADNLDYLNTLFYTKFFDSGWKLLAVDVALILAVAWPWRNRAVRWACFFNLTATLPISIIPPHGNNCLYMPLFGWALLLSIALVKMIDLFSPTVIWPRFKISRRAIRSALVFCAACGVAYFTVESWRHVPAFIISDQRRTLSLIQQFESLPFHPRPNSQIIIFDDPLNGYASLSVAELVWNDRSLILHMSRDYPGGPTDAQVATYDSVLAFEGGKLQVVRDHRTP